MSCYGPEKISLLIDGELGPEETRASEAHVETCAACRRTYADFLALREAVASYPVPADARATSAALEKILAAGGAHAPVAQAAPRPAAPSWRERLGLPQFTPAVASAFALVVVAVLVGAIWSLNRGDGGRKSPTQLAEQAGTQPAPAAAAAKAEAPASKDAPAPAGAGPAQLAAAQGSAGSDIGVKPPPVQRAGNEKGNGRVRGAVAVARREARERRTTLESAPTPEAPGTETANAPEAGGGAGAGAAEDVLGEFRPLMVAASAAGAVFTPRPLPEAVAGEGRETTRHLEQAQRLLRTIRNTRPDGPGALLEDERRRSQRLLYRNIVLRREAARAGNAPVERALDSLEPILIDIANLPARPGREDVGAIQERMRRKDIVAVLQANIAAAPRTN